MILFPFFFFNLPIIYSCLAISFFFNFICHLLSIYLSLAIILLVLLLFYYHCYDYFITTVILTNITGRVILGESSGGEFQARNSNGMVYPYSSR